MRIEVFRLARLMIGIFLVTVTTAGAQQMPPAEPPLPLPSAQSDTPTLRPA